MATTPPEQDIPPVGPVPRPRFQLRSLPLRWRWEVTRRHPYYQNYWKAVRAHRRSEPLWSPLGSPAAALEPDFRRSVVIVLESIGVSGDPPDPVLDFDALGAAELHAAWLSGAVHPISFGGMAALLLSALPKNTLMELGKLFLQASWMDDEGKPPYVIQSLTQLGHCRADQLDHYPDEPIVSVNPAASGRDVVAAAESLLRDWKAERNLDQRRVRDDKFEQYLKAWDLREGWYGGRYDMARERTLPDIAKELGRPLSSVNSDFRSGFQLVIGHPFSPKLWWRTLGTLKLAELNPDDRPPLTRPMSSPIRRPVPETVLGQGLLTEIAARAVRTPSSAFADRILDLGDMIDVEELALSGLSTPEILKKLELSPSNTLAVQHIEWVLSRGPTSPGK